jgi:hypothetical protein
MNLMLQFTNKTHIKKVALREDRYVKIGKDLREYGFSFFWLSITKPFMPQCGMPARAKRS